MSTILDIPNTVWRDQLLPAMFRGQQFHMESMSRENGTHVVTHQFPKRDVPYSEPMGRRAFEFTLRGYTIAYPFNSNQPLYQRDYRVPRDNLIKVLEEGLPGSLQLPTLPPMYVLCTRYRVTEEEKLGGYCSFDMSFVEYGIKPTLSAQDTFAQVVSTSETLKQRVQAVLAQAPITVGLASLKPGRQAGGPQGPIVPPQATAPPSIPAFFPSPIPPFSPITGPPSVPPPPSNPAPIVPPSNGS
jgi:prophage DNA circulation protein